MPTTTTLTLPEGVIEHDGMLWKPHRGATASADEFIAARTVFKEITDDSRWNPWVREDRAVEYEQALEVMGQWRRAEPNHRMLSPRQLEARWAKQDKLRERTLAKRRQEREAREPLYDEQRFNARLALMEQRSWLEYETAERAGYRDGSVFPKMDSARRNEKMSALQQSVEEREIEVERLAAIVGDCETVVDQNGCCRENAAATCSSTTVWTESGT